MKLGLKNDSVTINEKGIEEDAHAGNWHRQVSMLAQKRIEEFAKSANKEIPGIMEYIRVKYGENIPGALLSRSIAGSIDKALVYALPGSVKAVKEYTEEILRTLEHSIFMIHGINSH